MRSTLSRLSLACAVIAGDTAAQEPLPDFQTCLDIEVARYERELKWLQQRPQGAIRFDIGGVEQVYYCGSVGIVTCDRGEAPVPCQKAFAADQDALSDRILAGLPEHDTNDTEDDRLYRRALLLAQGRSAGPDCSGASAPIEAWCSAREANSRLQSAVLAWQIGRYLGLAAPATEAGWARPPPPIRPRPRPER